MLATAFQILHFDRFLECGPIPESLVSKITEITDNPSPELLQSIESLADYKELMVKYTEFMASTLEGQHGSTAQYWMLYIKLVNIFMRFSRACRTNDLELFVYTLSQMLPIFFAANRPNYSRWMVRYYLNLLNVDNTHPGVRQMLEQGALSIKRTS